jgi:hypothetical protein
LRQAWETYETGLKTLTLSELGKMDLKSNNQTFKFFSKLTKQISLQPFCQTTQGLRSNFMYIIKTFLPHRGISWRHNKKLNTMSALSKRTGAAHKPLIIKVWRAGREVLNDD